MVLAGAVLGTLASAALLTALLLPGLRTAVTAESADGSTAYEIGGSGSTGVDATVTPAAGWEVRHPPAGGLLVTSPDRVLSVRLLPAPGEASTGQAGTDGAAIRAQGPGDSGPRTETLASGLVLTYVGRADGIDATMRLGSGAVLISVDVARGRLDDYRPALSALLESVEGKVLR